MLLLFDLASFCFVPRKGVDLISGNAKYRWRTFSLHASFSRNVGNFLVILLGALRLLFRADAVDRIWIVIELQEY